MNTTDQQYANPADEQTEDNDNNKPVREGQPMGGHNFGGDSHPPTGNDKANPSRNAGNTNAYLGKTEPLEEYPEDNNFKPKDQEGAPDYDGAQ